MQAAATAAAQADQRMEQFAQREQELVEENEVRGWRGS